jgi:hypothetical protein
MSYCCDVHLFSILSYISCHSLESWQSQAIGHNTRSFSPSYRPVQTQNQPLQHGASVDWLTLHTQVRTTGWNTHVESTFFVTRQCFVDSLLL